MEIRSLQYLMGHSDVNTTLNIYAHSSFEAAVQAFERFHAGEKDTGETAGF